MAAEPEESDELGVVQYYGLYHSLWMSVQHFTLRSTTEQIHVHTCTGTPHFELQHQQIRLLSSLSPRSPLPILSGKYTVRVERVRTFIYFLCCSFIYMCTCIHAFRLLDVRKSPRQALIRLWGFPEYIYNNARWYLHCIECCVLPECIWDIKAAR